MHNRVLVSKRDRVICEYLMASLCWHAQCTLPSSCDGRMPTAEWQNWQWLTTDCQSLEFLCMTESYRGIQTIICDCQWWVKQNPRLTDTKWVWRLIVGSLKNLNSSVTHSVQQLEIVGCLSLSAMARSEVVWDIYACHVKYKLFTH